MTSDLDHFIEHVADQIMARGAGVGAIFFLEACKPLTLVGQQFLVFCHPAVRVFFDNLHIPRVIELLDDRRNVERLICALEARLEGES